MNRSLAAAAVMLLIATSCAHVDTVNYEAAYSSKTSKQPQDAGILLQSPTPGAPSGTTFSAAAITGTAAVKTAVKNKKMKVKQLVVNSDSMTFNKETTEAVFHGNVETDAGTAKVYSDTLRSKNYQDNAVAEGNVKALYKEYGINIDCDSLDYTGKMTNITAHKNVTARKILDNGNTVTIKADMMEFDTNADILTAKKSPSRVRVTMQDIMAFADEIIYNNKTRQLEMRGMPFLKKGKSLFFSDYISLDVDKKSIKMKESIWTKMFYHDFEKAGMEVKVEKDKSGTSR